MEVLDEHHILLDGKAVRCGFHGIGNQPVYSLLINGRSLEANAVPTGDGWQVLLHGKMFEARVEDEQAIRARSVAHAAARDAGRMPAARAHARAGGERPRRRRARGWKRASRWSFSNP